MQKIESRVTRIRAVIFIMISVHSSTIAIAIAM